MIRLLIIISFIFLLTGCEKEKTYCGKVVDRFRTDAGYKSSPEAHIVFYCDSLKKNIDVQVTWNTYANCQVGETVCFGLLKRYTE